MSCLLRFVAFLTLCGEVSASGDVRLIYTGDAQAFLEPCGCTENQLGGIGRQARLVRGLKQKNALTLSVGGALAGDTRLDKLRGGAFLSTLKRIGYDVAHLGASELRFGNDHATSSGLTWVSANVELQGISRARTFEVGGRQVHVSAVSGNRQARRIHAEGRMASAPTLDLETYSYRGAVQSVQSVAARLKSGDLLVLMSDLQADSNTRLAQAVPRIDVILASSERAVKRYVGATSILGMQPEGRGIGVAEILPDTITARTVWVTDAIVPDPEIARFVEEFYAAVSKDPALRDEGPPRFVGMSEERAVLAGKNAYVGSNACAPCHRSAFESWERSPHATAFDRLLGAQRHFAPGCVTCHTTGYGYETGYEIGIDNQLRDVQCETCHGPGRNHVRRPEAQNIRLASDPGTCRTCHTEDQTPDFDDRIAHMLEEVHPKLARPASPVSTDRVRLDLYVMPHCPFGRLAIQQLVPTVVAAPGQVDLYVRYIADEEDEQNGAPRAASVGRRRLSCRGKATDGAHGFLSLHGADEVEAGIRQVAVEELYPNRYLAYVLSRAKRLDVSWKEAMAELDIDVARIEAFADSDEGKAAYKKNIDEANVRGIHASPTLLVNGVEVEWQEAEFTLREGLCALDEQQDLCKTMPVCIRDEQCDEGGHPGVCENAGTAVAACRRATHFDVILVNDEDCDVCDTGTFIQSTLELFPGARFEHAERGSPKAMALTEDVDVDRYPVAILRGDFAEAARFKRFTRLLRPFDDIYVADPAVFDVSQLAVPGGRQGTDVWIDLASASVGTLSYALGDPQFRRETTRYHLIGGASEVNAGLVCLGKNAQAYIDCVVSSTLSYEDVAACDWLLDMADTACLTSPETAKRVEEAARRGQRFLRGGSGALIDGTYVVTARGLTSIGTILAGLKEE